MTLQILNTLIIKCEDNNARVCAMVCDMGNTKYLSELKVYQYNHWFTNPCDTARKVFIFADIPHCFKNMRNHTLDYSMVIKSSESKTTIISKKMFQNLIDVENIGTLKLCPKLSEIHINVHGHDRQRVKYATQLFSQTVGKALKFLYGETYSEQADIILKLDQFFDVMNSSSAWDAKDYKCGLGEHNDSPLID